MFMKDKQQIQQEVEKTLNSLDNIQRAEASPYLFTRVKAALQKEEKSFWTIATGFLSKPVVAIATILITIMINAAVFFNAPSSEAVQNNQNGEQIFASDYDLTATTFYDATVDQQ